MKNLSMRVFAFMLFTLFLFSCEKENLNENLEPEVQKKQFVLQNGALKLENKEALKLLVATIKETGAENFYNKEIKNLTKNGYEPLRPYFSEEETEEHEAFIEKKGNKLKKEQEAEGKSNEEIEFDIEDELIVDSNFEVLINFNREIIVENKLYKYTKDGIYSVEEDKIIEFRDFIQSQSTQNKNNSKKESLPAGIDFIEMDLTNELVDNEQEAKGLNIQRKTTARYSDLAQAKLNFGTEVFRKNSSVWGRIFGYSRYTYDWAPNNRRVKIKFWNRNWFLFSSMGVEVRFQKKRRFWRWSYYVRSYPSRIALGVNSLKYNYKQVLKPYISPTVFGDLFYTYKGINYHSNGKRSLVKPPKLQFPVDKLLSPDDLYITIVNPFNHRAYTIGQSSEQIVKQVNNASSDLLKGAIRSIPGHFRNKPNSDTTVSILNILKDGTELTVFNQNWIKYGDNNITKRLSLDVPLIGIKSTIDGDGGFSKNIKVPFPKLSLSNYDTGSIDIYGGAFYAGKWYGKRLISSDFKR